MGIAGVLVRYEYHLKQNKAKLRTKAVQISLTPANFSIDGRLSGAFFSASHVLTATLACCASRPHRSPKLYLDSVPRVL